MTIARLKTRLRDTSTTNDLPRSGWPLEMTLRQDRHVCIIHLRKRFVNASQMQDKSTEDIQTEYLLKHFVTDSVMLV